MSQHDPNQPYQPPMQQPYGDGQVKPPVIHKKPHPTRNLVLTGIGSLILGVVIGAAPSSNSATDAASPTKTVTVAGPAGATVTPPPVVKTVTRPGPTVKVTETQKPAEAAGAIGEGTWEVGVDVAPGRYKTTVAVTSDMCYWKITTTGKPDNIVDNDIVTGGRPTVTIKKGQDFTTQDCGEWKKVG